MAQPADKLLQRPLYVFDLPEELLYTLQLHAPSNNSPPPPSNNEASEVPSPSLSETGRGDGSSGSTTTCALCSLSFATLQEQRSHVRSDLHGYNLKQKIRGRPPVTEAQFEQLIASLDDSISGSDTSDSSESDDDGQGTGKPKDSTLSALLKRQAHLADGDADDAPAKARQRGSGKPPLIWFESPKLPKNTTLGIYRAVFSTSEQDHEQTLVETIQRRQLRAELPQSTPKPTSQNDEGGVALPPTMPSQLTPASGPHYFLCMIGGGHFAGMLVSLTPKLTKKHGFEDRSATVIAHKTFHRYTTRRKQGGSQSANDNAKGNAHSAGSSIRRYNEVALLEEIRALLAEWKQWIDSADLLFVRASGSTNRRTLFGPYDGQVLSVKDDRLRGFPFNTRRATQSELMRSFVELTRVKVNVVDEAALARQAEEAAAAAAKAQAQANGKPATPKPPKPSKEDEQASLHTTQLQALIRRSKAPGMLSYLQTNHLSPDYRFFPPEQNHQAPTPLHLAAASGSAACITSLLVKAGADPNVRNGDDRPAFEIAGDRATRDAFRLARSQIGEARWDWDGARVPPALGQAEIDARVARDKAEKAADDEAEKRRREAEVERLRREDAERQAASRESKFGRGHALEKPKMTAEERRAEEAKGMSDEMRLRLEREKRARAAEERIKRLQGK